MTAKNEPGKELSLKGGDNEHVSFNSFAPLEQ